MKTMAAADPASWKIPTIIDAVIGCTDNPDIWNSFAVYCMIAPAPDIRWMVAKAPDKKTAFLNAHLQSC